LKKRKKVGTFLLMILFAQTGLPGTCSKANSYVKKKEEEEEEVSGVRFVSTFCMWEIYSQFLLRSGVGQG
jgi:hypothetical protein